MPGLELTGPQFPALSQALRSRLRLSQFDRMLAERLDINREDIALGDDYTEIVFKVISEANRSGWVYRLVDAARKEKPGEPVFVEYARLVKIAPVGTPDTDQFAELESIVNPKNPMLDIVRFRSRLGEIEGQVCRIDLRGDGTGTGFLIGAGTVLTNYHVVESLVKQEHTLQDFTCRFDYKRREDGKTVDDGTVFKVTKLVGYSPYDPVDKLSGSQTPDPENLDYALLRLEGEPGNSPIGGKVGDDTRGYIELPETAAKFKEGDPLFIVQHPMKSPMQLALDPEAVIGLNTNGTRVRYKTNTRSGSSGSPCFDQNWNLVALHHSGDRAVTPKWNEGIPISLVKSQIQVKGWSIT